MVHHSEVSLVSFFRTSSSRFCESVGRAGVERRGASSRSEWWVISWLAKTALLLVWARPILVGVWGRCVVSQHPLPLRSALAHRVVFASQSIHHLVPGAYGRHALQ